MVSVCGTCRGLQKHIKALETPQETDSDTLQWLNTSLPNLRASSSNCQACALLLNGIILHHERFAGVDEQRIQIRAESFASKPGRTFQDHLSVELRWKEHDAHVDDCQDDQHEHVGYPDLKLEFFTDGGGQSSFTAIGRGRPISENPLQDAGLSTARGMVKNCLSGHSRCRHQKPTTLPKRVLDVLHGPESKSVALHESGGDEQRREQGEYIALSHVGEGPRTTKQNLESHLKGIPWSALPKTYQEAILLTRALGIRYLWIDSLCQIQDYDRTKLEESMQLDQIFGNAFLTIAATSAPDVTYPLFAAKTPPFTIQATDTKGQLSKVYVREQPSHYSFKAPFDEGSHMNDWELPFNTSSSVNQHAPLLQRAWAYIERLLSPRVLHFTSSEMILECREAFACECGRIADPAFDSRATDSIKQDYSLIVCSPIRSTQNPDSTSPDFRRENALHLWTYIITDFTARAMPSSSRLPAISSIARTLLPAMHSGYIAGHWTFSTLSLLWYPSDNTNTSRAAGTPAPSWSWAALAGSAILFDNASAMDLACRAGFGASAWSPVLGGEVRLSAGLAGEVSVRRGEEDGYVLARNGVAVEFEPDVRGGGEDALGDGEGLVVVLVSMTFRSSILGLVLKAVGGVGGGKAGGVPSGNVPSGGLPASPPPTLSITNPPLYRRVGRFECYECRPDNSGADEMSEDAEALFEHWFPEIRDMTQLDSCAQRHFTVI